MENGDTENRVRQPRVQTRRHLQWDLARGGGENEPDRVGAGVDCSLEIRLRLDPAQLHEEGHDSTVTARRPASTISLTSCPGSSVLISAEPTRAARYPYVATRSISAGSCIALSATLTTSPGSCPARAAW